jgi:putative PIG3 family NAD(P)H quinone oxidoreductase
VIVERPGGPEALRLAEVPDPEPTTGEVLLEVRATAVNRADVLQRRGRYPPPEGASTILGLEAAGVVAAVGAGVEGWTAGDRAMALLAGGGYAERVAVPHGQLMPIPEGLSFTEAAAVPEVFLTSWMALARIGRLGPDETLLVHAVASGVGTAAVQVARELGARVVGTSRSAGKLALPAELGAATVVARDGRFAEEVRGLAGPRGVDLVLDLVGPTYLNENAACLAVGGRVVILSLIGGSRAEVDFAPLLPRQAAIHTATLRARTTADKAAIVADFAPWGLPRLADGRLRPIIDRVLPIERVAEAHEAVESDATVGKVVLRLGA